MSDDRNESEVVTSVEEEQVDALVENEILDEESLEETYSKGKKKVNAMKYNSKEEPVDEEEEDEEEVKKTHLQSIFQKQRQESFKQQLIC